MTVYELKSMLEDYDDDMEIVMKGSNSIYADEISGVLEEKGVRSHWGDDYPALVLYSRAQVGAVWDVEDLDIREE